jgi:hypothetical protein
MAALAALASASVTPSATSRALVVLAPMSRPRTRVTSSTAHRAEGEVNPVWYWLVCPVLINSIAVTSSGVVGGLSAHDVPFGS